MIFINVTLPSKHLSECSRDQTTQLYDCSVDRVMV